MGSDPMATLAALEMRIADGSVLKLIRQWLKACAKEPNGEMTHYGLYRLAWADVRRRT